MKTAVEWLYDQIENEGKCIYEVMEQAKEMEQEQMKLSRMPIAYDNKAWERLIEKHFEQWYNETFKSE